MTSASSHSDSEKLPKRGQLTIFLGYAAGVGKTYQMLEEAQDLKTRGIDIVIGYFEPHARKDTIALIEGLEVVPRRRIDYRGTTFEEMDTPAILDRHPQICVVDEFPHTNIPGCERDKRWEDVQAMRDAGIAVLTTMNIQHLESLNDQVWQITGVKVKETIPDWVVQQADDVVMVDLTPRALINRLERGVVYPADKVQRALDNFFQESALVALRELALRQAAYEVEARQSNTLNTQSTVTTEIPQHATAVSQSKLEKILIYITADPNTAMLVRRAKRVADFLHTDCFAVAVNKDADLRNMPPKEREAVERHLNFARNLHIETRLIEGNDPAEALIRFARLNGITQLYINRPHERGWHGAAEWRLVENIIWLAGDLRVTIVAHRKRHD